MSERKSPEKSATLYKLGTKKIGNDNNIWITFEDKNNRTISEWFEKRRKITFIKIDAEYQTCPQLSSWTSAKN